METSCAKKLGRILKGRMLGTSTETGNFLRPGRRNEALATRSKAMSLRERSGAVRRRAWETAVLLGATWSRERCVVEKDRVRDALNDPDAHFFHTLSADRGRGVPGCPHAPRRKAAGIFGAPPALPLDFESLTRQDRA
jgi:hypothetical protein